MSAVVDYVLARAPELGLRTVEHLVLTGISTAAAIAVGVPLGVVAFRRQRLRSWLLSVIGVIQTVPSLAMLALLLVLFGRIGVAPALVALTLYALLPVVRNTVVGLDGVDPSVAEAARGLGMTPAQELLRVRMPLGLPVIMAGVRTAAVIGVGIATLSAFIGAGGLGQFINRGLALSDTGLILLGAVPAGVLALLVDGSLAGLGWATDAKRHRGHGGPLRWATRSLAFAAPVLLLVLPVVGLAARAQVRSLDAVRICTKNFTEQILLGEIMAQTLEARTDLRVERRFGLGGTIICHNALTAGEIDLYAEYTGTALTTILGESLDPDGGVTPSDVLTEVRSAYAEAYDARWLQPFGFDNTYVLMVAGERADSLGWMSVSDVAGAAPGLSVGFTAEFAERPDGYPGFSARYGIAFGETRDLDPGILYRAVADGEVDAAFGFATDGRIDQLGLTVLEDDRGFFPPYEAAPVVRLSALRAYPGLEPALNALADHLPDSTMRRLNLQAERGNASIAEVAEGFLEEIGVGGA